MRYPLFSAKFSVCLRTIARGAWRSACVLPAALAALLLLPAQGPEGPAALAQDAALASVRAQIERYGCHLPQYANSVQGCRELNARLRALQSGPRRASSQPYPGQTRERERKRASSGGGFFSALFGGRSRNRDGERRDARYETHDVHPGNAAFSFTPRTDAYSSSGWGGARYRTLCVRTCDGYYFPMSFSTTRSRFARDAQQCQASCGAPAKLFYHRNPGADVEHMVDLQGRRYADMENAFRYREEMVEDCRCKPQPWTDAAKQQFEQRVAGIEETDATEAPRPAPAEARPAPGPRPDARSQDKAAAPAEAAGSAQTNWRTSVDEALRDGRWWAGSW